MDMMDMPSRKELTKLSIMKSCSLKYGHAGSAEWIRIYYQEKRRDYFM
jgi:hypothetical protein